MMKRNIIKLPFEDLRIANVSEEGRYGGPRGRIAAVAARLKAYGVHTTAVCPERNSEQSLNRMKELGVETKCLGLTILGRDKLQMLRYLVSFLSELYGLLKYLKLGRFDVVHCNGSYQIKGVIAGKLAGAKVIWHLNDTRDQRIIWLGFRLLAQFFCDGFILGGERVMWHYMGGSSLLKKPHMVIQAPVDARYFSSDCVLAEHAPRSEMSLKVVTVANINPAKGLEYFIEMVKWLNDVHGDLSFFIVGHLFESQQCYYDKLTALTKLYGIRNIFFRHGVMDVRPFLKMADIFVCSSVHEAGPMSVWEAMAMEKAIVSTDVGDVARYIRDGENGFIVPPRNARVLAEKVEILIGSESLRKKFASRVRKIAVDNFAVDICAKKHVQAYEMIVGLNNNRVDYGV